MHPLHVKHRLQCPNARVPQRQFRVRTHVVGRSVLCNLDQIGLGQTKLRAECGQVAGRGRRVVGGNHRDRLPGAVADDGAIVEKNLVVAIGLLQLRRRKAHGAC